MPKLASKIAKVSVIEGGPENWCVIAQKADGKTISLGNYKTSEEAHSLKDFLDAALEAQEEFGILNYLAIALQELAA